MADLKIPENVVEAAARVLRYEESSGLCKLDHPCLLCDCNAKLSDEYARLHARKALEAGFEEMGLRRTSKTVESGKGDPEMYFRERLVRYATEWEHDDG